MLQFKKLTMKRSVRKKQKMEVDAAEAEEEIRSNGLFEAEEEIRSNGLFDGDEEEELRKSLERARKLTLEKQEGLDNTFPGSIASLANDSTLDCAARENSRVVFTEMEEFVWGIQFDEEEKKVGGDMLLPKSTDEEIMKNDAWRETNEEERERRPNETMREVPIGKGLSGALKHSREQGVLQEDNAWGGRNTDKKKSIGGRGDQEGEKEIHIERTDEYGRIVTGKEAYRMLCHQFHGKWPGKKKQEKRMLRR